MVFARHKLNFYNLGLVVSILLMPMLVESACRGQHSQDAGISKQLFEKAFNANSIEELKKLVRRHFTAVDDKKAQRYAQLLLDLHREWGPIEVAEVNDVLEGSRRLATHVVIKIPKTDSWKCFQFFSSAEDPAQYNSFAIVDAIEPKSVPDGDIRDPGVQQWMADHIDWLVESRKLSGAFLVAKNGEVVFQKTCGWANFDKKIATGKATAFNLASGTKMFTSIAIAKLVEQGKLSFDQTLDECLPSYPNKDFAKKITIRHLLTHCSGLPEYWTIEYEKSWQEISRLDQILKFFADQPLVFEPGTQHQYCNTNFIVLGLVIERLYGQPFSDVIKRVVFEPAKMSDSGFFETKNPKHVNRLAVPYEFALVENGSESWFPAKLGKQGTSAGGSYSSIKDLAAFDHALTSHRLLGQKMSEEITKGKVGQTVGGKYAFGFMDCQFDGQRWIGHGGTGPGSYFEYAHFPENGYSVIFVANHDATAAHDVYRKLMQVVAQTK